ncbi:MAG: glycosyltransferase [Candidatus Zambryskibacteria bacterium]|nr:glycosyltransferase [Candidatus Zambryskibacteria bacterium]
MESKLIIGTVAELHKVKGLDILLYAWARFIAKYPNAELQILGDGEERGNLKALAKTLDISGSVKFPGYVNNVKEYLSTFDIFCLPSRSEALPYSLLEAGAAGLPVVATKVGGIPEVIENGINGALVEPENSEELFSTLLLFAESKDLRKRLGTNLKETVLKNFPVKKMVEETLRVYL